MESEMEAQPLRVDAARARRFAECERCSQFKRTVPVGSDQYCERARLHWKVVSDKPIAGLPARSIRYSPVEVE